MPSSRRTYHEPSTSPLSASSEEDSPDSGHGRSSFCAESSDDEVPLGIQKELSFLTPEQALEVVPGHLTPFEQKEIAGFAEIYFLGLPSPSDKIYRGTENGGFDSHTGWYLHQIRDHVAYRYERKWSASHKVEFRKVNPFLATKKAVTFASGFDGASSAVHKAYDHKTGRVVALKCIKNTEADQANAEREIKILRHLNEKDKEARCNIVRLLDSFVFRDHHFLVFNMITNSLLGYVRSKPENRLQLSEIRKIARALLRCLVLLHKEGIAHIDIKPENIMIQGDDLDNLVVIDFGSSSFADQRDKSIDYVQSRFYRAPEVILGLDFARPVDMWSFGCILGELLIGRPLLYGQHGEEDQFAAIVEVLGDMPASMMRDVERIKDVYNRHFIPKKKSGYDYRYMTNPALRDRERPKKKPLPSIFKNYNASPYFVDFVSGCLVLDPRLRTTPPAALNHPFVKVRYSMPQMSRLTVSDK